MMRGNSLRIRFPNNETIECCVVESRAGGLYVELYTEPGPMEDVILTFHGHPTNPLRRDSWLLHYPVVIERI